MGEWKRQRIDTIMKMRPDISIQSARHKDQQSNDASVNKNKTTINQKMIQQTKTQWE